MTGLNHLETLRECRVCPHECGADRLNGKTGVCGSDAGFNISSICIHRGEEPGISSVNGICNVFFSRCNLSCKFCQNWQISRNKGKVSEQKPEPETIIGQIIACLDQGCRAVGFVSPSHMIPQVKTILDALHDKGYFPIVVYNSNGYDKVSELRQLESYVDVYLPDFKYADDELAKELSGIKNYKAHALAALKEMYRQKGSTLVKDEDGTLERGMVIRHLVLPGYVSNSLEVLRLIAGELSSSVAVSLMSQYWPTPSMRGHASLSRPVNGEEYQQAVDELHHLGFYKGWVQDFESSSHYLPDFEKDHPFE